MAKGNPLFRRARSGGQGEQKGAQKKPSTPPPAAKGNRRLLFALGGLAVLLALGVLLVRALRSSEGPPPPPPPSVVYGLPSSPPAVEVVPKPVTPAPSPAPLAPSAAPGADGKASKALPPPGGENEEESVENLRDPFGLPPPAKPSKPQTSPNASASPRTSLPPLPSALPPPPVDLPKPSSSPDPFAGIKCLAVVLGQGGSAVLEKGGAQVVLSVGEESELVGKLRGVSPLGCEVEVKGKRKLIQLEGSRK